MSSVAIALPFEVRRAKDASARHIGDVALYAVAPWRYRLHNKWCSKLQCETSVS